MTEKLLTYFASYLAREGLKEQSIKTYLAAIRHLQLTMGLPDPRDSSSLPRLRLVLMGIRRMQADSRNYTPRTRLPITPPILHRIRELWNGRSTRASYVMPWAAVTLCFFGFFRSGEITLPSQGAFNPGKHLSWGDVAIDSPTKPRALKVHLRQSKTDQFGKGMDVVIGSTGDPLCPVAAVSAYMAIRGGAAGPFFVFPDGTPLTKAKFVDITRQALSELGLPWDQFAGHSYRIGAATTAAQAGLEDSLIMTLGRWNSASYLRYIRTPREELAAATARLTQGTSSA